MTPLAFYDFDGTLVSTNVVTQYVWYVRRQPRPAAKLAKLALMVPALVAIDLASRRKFNEVFYREYRGMSEAFLRAEADRLFDELFRPAIHAGARELVARDRDDGFRTVLLTGSPEFALAPVARHFGFDVVLANRLEFANGVATGAILPPVLAGPEKVAAMRRLAHEYNVGTEHCKAYTDSKSDLPMLEAVGLPAAVNPDARLRREALRRGWPVLDLGTGNHGITN
jgi:HAD superfamily hydrolase (TIGR01490 family)